MSKVVKVENDCRSDIYLKGSKTEQGFVSVRFNAQSNGVDEFRAAVESIQKEGGQILVAFWVGGNRLIAGSEILANEYDFPITVLQGDPCREEKSECQYGGLQFWVVKNVQINPVKLNGRIVGNWFEDDYARYCYLGRIVADEATADCGLQTTQAFQNIDKALRTIEMNFLDVVRTWCYLKDLLTWYDDFNVARTAFFKETGVFEAMIPSSTGIGACLPQGGDIVLGALAVKPKNDAICVREVFSPLQCPAKDYRSSFARASEIKTPDGRLLLVSGTASIEPGGATVYIDDIDKQIELTFEVIEAILKTENYSWEDCSRAIAYYKDSEFIKAWEAFSKKRHLPKLPMIHLHADVCRDDLLYEIELDFLQADRT